MSILTTLKRTTALAAIAALPLVPATALAESAQVTGTQPPAAQEETQAGSQQTDAQQTTTQQAERDLVPSDKEIDPYKSQAETAPESATVIKKDGTYSETTGPDGTQSGSTGTQARAGQQGAPENVEEQQLPGVQSDGGSGDPWAESTERAQSDQQQTDQQPAGEDKGPANETGVVTEGQEGTQSGEAPDQAPTDDQTGLSEPAGQGQAGQDGTAAGGGQGQDALVAKVGDREIRRSDVLTVIGMLPPQLQQQPPEMLIPIALDQLVMRELILQEAKAAGMESDPTVASLAQGASERAKEDAMVQVWLEQELGKAVTEEKVKQTYETVKQQMGEQAPDMETLRPQIEQELRQQAFLDLSEELQSGAEITLYGPDGQAMTQ